MSIDARPRIAPALAALAVPLDALTPHPRNPRRGDVGAIAASLQQFGQVRPIVVQRATDRIIAGNHLYLAARALGWPEVAAVRVDLDDDAALAYLVADNRTQELGAYDDEALVDLLVDLRAQGLLAGTGYDADAIDALIAEVRGEGGEVDLAHFLATDDVSLAYRVIIDGLNRPRAEALAATIDGARVEQYRG
jgi:ParB-like chromosome segregation protein Spo0J